MIIKTVVVGELDTNCYIVASDKGKEAVVIDPGDDAGRIIKALHKGKFKPVLIVNTHAHPDHVGANQELAKEFHIEAAVGDKDHKLITRWGSYFEEFAQLNIEDLSFKRFLTDGDIVKAGKLELKVMETPGHSEGSICLYGDGVLFSGDTLFAGDHGRTDIPGGSEEEMKSTLAMLMTLPPDTKVYPGHGRPTTIKEKRFLHV